MKNIKVILLALVVVATFSGIVVFTACNKTSCSDIVCQNGGTCSGGKCTCPAGYSGIYCQVKPTSAIKYVNNTFTPISITVNDNPQTIPVGGSVTYTGTYGTAASGSASTSASASSLGINVSGGTLGTIINWQLNNTFPASDTLRVPLDVGSTYFFLRMVNNGSADIIDFYVNVNEYGQFYQDATIPHNGVTYDLGYYLAFSSSNVQTQSSASKVVWKQVTLPFTSNQSFTVTIP